MTTAQWDRVKKLFHEALEKPVGERAAYVAAIAGDDDTVQTEVMSLLASHNEAFLETPAAALPGALPDALSVRCVNGEQRCSGPRDDQIRVSAGAMIPTHVIRDQIGRGPTVSESAI